MVLPVVQELVQFLDQFSQFEFQTQSLQHKEEENCATSVVQHMFHSRNCPHEFHTLTSALETIIEIFTNNISDLGTIIKIFIH